jgi:hypothetical protein
MHVQNSDCGAGFPWHFGAYPSAQTFAQLIGGGAVPE